LNKVGVARLSVLSNTVLVAFKLAVGMAINSVSVLSEAIHSGLDLVAAIIAFFAVSRSGKPPDAEHQYGHGKIENVSGVIEALLIFAAAAWIIREAIVKLITGAEVEMPIWGLIVMGFSAVVNWIVSSLLMKTAQETDSIALEADAQHLRVDVYTSAGVAGGLLLIWISGIQMFDPLIAIGVGLLILKAACDLTRKAFLPLLDTSLPLQEEKKIREIIAAYGANYVGYHQLRTRKAGSERFIDLHLVMPQHLNISESHMVCDAIEEKIREAYPSSHVLIHVEPCRVGYDCPDCTQRECKLLLKGEKDGRNSASEGE
jgi:cation diffusion facilitator family transporter